MQQRALGKTGLQVSVLGFGASPLGGVFEEVDEAEGARAVQGALELGINFFDVSPFYGATKAETALGRALKGIKRERYILATKVGRYGPDDFDFSAQGVTRGFEKSLQRLGVDHVDLLQCHDIEFGDLNQVVQETLPALRQLQQAGKTRFIGITGLPLRIFREVLGQVEVDTILSYCRYTLADSALEDLIPFLEEKEAGIINAAPLSMGLLTQKGPPEWHPASGEVKTACARAAALCQQRGTDVARLALQFSTSNPRIATTLVGMAHVREVESNIACIEDALDEELLRDVQSVLAPIHNRSWSSGRLENNDEAEHDEATSK